VGERFATAIKIYKIPLFDVSRHCHGHGVIGRSTFDVRCSLVSFIDQTGRSQPVAALPALRSLEGEAGTPETYPEDEWPVSAANRPME